jgi:hypothetical protein
MKSIANQYRDLKEGRMSQFNFMRNLRMSMPQHVTNVTSFKDAVRILKSKSIITETQENIEEVSNDRAFDVAKKLRDEYNMDEEGVYVYLVDDMGLDNMTAQSVVDQVFGGGNDEDDFEYSDDYDDSYPTDYGNIDDFNDGEFYEAKDDKEEDDEDADLEDLLAQYGEEEAGKYTKFNDFEGGISEAKKKKEPKAELHPNAIHPQELRMGIKVELEHTDDLDKAKKIALDHLAENPFYYTALKLAGVESPSAPKVKAPVEKKAKKKKEAAELVDKDNQMQKIKMPKSINEVRLNAMPGEETNDTIKHAMQYIDSEIANPTLKAISDKITLQPLRDNRALLRYEYWEVLPQNAIDALEKQFDVEADTDVDDETLPREYYIISSKKVEKPEKYRAFQSKLEEIVREVLAEMQSDDQEIDNIAMAMDENKK